jgi:TolB-like protein/DNA-binding winged helix-turn-helix (wHTH) protein
METLPAPPPADIVSFGTFEVNLRTGELRKRGIRIALQEQPLRILGALLERPGEVVTREQLCRRLWPEGTFVDFEHSLNAAVRRLRLTLGDEAEVPRFIETVHKRGYRFIALNDMFPRIGQIGSRPSPATIAHIVRKRARLAVLPFGPFDGFTDGLTEEAITQLAQACPQTIGVIARTSVERARREGGGAAEIARALSADYLVEGSVRREGDRLRITAQLIESHEETHLWAQTFDRVMKDTLTLQTEVAEEIARAVTEALTPAKRPALPGA